MSSSGLHLCTQGCPLAHTYVPNTLCCDILWKLLILWYKLQRAKVDKDLSKETLQEAGHVHTLMVGKLVRVRHDTQAVWMLAMGIICGHVRKGEFRG